MFRCLYSKLKKINMNNADLQLAYVNVLRENTLLKTEIDHIFNQKEIETSELKAQLNKKIDGLERIVEDTKQEADDEKWNLVNKLQKCTKLSEQLELKLKISEDHLNMKTKENNDVMKKLNECDDHFQRLVDEKDSQLQELKEQKMLLEERVKILENDQNSTLQKDPSILPDCHQKQLEESRMKEIERDYETKVKSANTESANLKVKISHFEELLEQKSKEFKEEVEEKMFLKRNLQSQISNLEKKFSDLNLKYLCETRSLTEENNKLSQKLQTILSSRPNEGSCFVDDCNQLTAQMETKIQELSSLRKENALLKGKVNLLEQHEELLSKEKKATRGLRKDIEERMSENNDLKNRLVDLDKTELMLKEKLQNNEEQLRNLYADLRKERAESQEKIMNLKLNGDDKMAELSSRIQSLENQLCSTSHQHQSEVTELKKKVRSYGQLIKKLRFKLDTWDLKSKELEAKNEALREGSVPTCKFLQLQNQLQKHLEFAAFVKGALKVDPDVEDVQNLNVEISRMTNQLSLLEENQQEALMDYDIL